MRAKPARAETDAPSASATAVAASTTAPLSTGSAPGMPRQTGHVREFGAPPAAFRHPQKILVRVVSCACTSKPMTGSNSSGTPYGLGGLRDAPAARSYARATRNMTDSRNLPTIIWRPTGRPDAQSPQGTESAAMPARLTGTV